MFWIIAAIVIVIAAVVVWFLSARI